eukprot:6598070-Pyramimonas_sp.AAC.1
MEVAEFVPVQARVASSCLAKCTSRLRATSSSLSSTVPASSSLYGAGPPAGDRLELRDGILPPYRSSALVAAPSCLPSWLAMLPW